MVNTAQIDAVVLRGLRGPVAKNKYIDKLTITLQNQYSDPKYYTAPLGNKKINRGDSNEATKPPLSVNRCGENTPPFDHTPFKNGSPTPGNFCHFCFHPL